MKNVALLLALTLFCGAPAALAQSTYKPPIGYSLQDPDDYAEYEPQVVATVNWLEATPIGKEAAKRQEATRFLFQWISGTPTVSVQLQKFVADLTGQNPELMMLFMGGWARYQIQHPEVKDAVVLNTEGIKTLLKGYQIGNMKRTKPLDEVAKLGTGAALTEWVKKQLAN
ncbi:hypothetical protein [Hymenobacter tenuis]